MSTQSADQNSNDNTDNRDNNSCNIQRVSHPPEQLDWIDDSTTHAISDSIDRSGPPKQGSCKLCGFKGTLRRVRVHAKQHQLRYFCPCKLNSVSRDTVYSHQKKQGASASSHHPLYTVDANNYGGFCQAMGWNPPPPFTPCIPIQSGNTQRQEPAPAPRPVPARRTRTPLGGALALPEQPGHHLDEPRHLEDESAHQGERDAPLAPHPEDLPVRPGWRDVGPAELLREKDQLAETALAEEKSLPQFLLVGTTDIRNPV